MNKLCYVAKPREFESPKGLLIRTAFFNGYGSVQHLCSELDIALHADQAFLLSQDSALLKLLKHECPEYAALLTDTFYAPTAAEVSNTENTRFSFQPFSIEKYFSYCPDCLQQEIITVFQDYKKLSACPIHYKKIIKACPKCGTRERWVNIDLERCKCGFLRKTVLSEKAALIKNKPLDIFERKYPMDDLQFLSSEIDHCKVLWNERKNTDNATPFEMEREFHQHVLNMATVQLNRYPGFTLDMHLAPWITRDGGKFYSLAHDFICSHFNSLCLCDPAVCCSGVKITAKEFQFCIKGRYYPDVKRLITKNLIKQRRLYGQPQNYKSIIPICELVKKINSANLVLTPSSLLDHPELISTTEAAVYLNCVSSTVVWLSDQGFLKKKGNQTIRGSGHKILIQKSSVAAFIEYFILVGEISAALNIAPREVIRITNKLEISPVHSFRGPYVFARKDIERLKVQIQAEVNVRHPPYDTYNKKSNELNSEPTSLNEQTEIQIENIQKPSFSKQFCEICKGPHFKKNQLPKILNASPRLIHYRFFLSGLIHPHVTERGKFYSQQDIDFMINHFQQHVSITQATKIMECSPTKLNKLINLFELKPSLKIKYSSGEVQSLYSREEIETIKNQQ